MQCHVCGESAVGQCRICRQHYCSRHGRRFCVHCREVALPPDEAPPQGKEAAPPDRPVAQEAAGSCVLCGRAEARACPLCGSGYCAEHRGWREVRVGRYKIRRPVCLRCGARRGRLPAPLVWMIAVVIAGAVSAVVYTFLTTGP